MIISLENEVIMNKLLVSIIFGLSFAAVTPAQAEWRDWIPGISYLRGNQAQNQPVHHGRPDIEAQQPQSHVNLPAPVRQSWFSGIFSNPLSGFYSRFSAWWNKDKVRVQAAAEAQKTIYDLQSMNQERAQVVIELNERKAKEAQDNAAQIEALAQQITELRKIAASAANNSLEQVQALRKREQELQAQLELLRKQNSSLTDAHQKAQASHDQERSRFAKVAADRILQEEIKHKAELEAREKTEKERVQAQNNATIKSLREFAHGLNKQVEGFQQRAHEKLDRLDQRVLGIATATEEKNKEIQSAKAPKTTLIKIIRDRQRTEEQKIDEIKKLLQKGADIDEKSKDIPYATPLMMASDAGYTKIVKFLLEQKAQVNELDGVQSPALFYGAVKGHSDVVHELLAHNANVKHINKRGRTVLLDMFYSIGSNEGSDQAARIRFRKNILNITQTLVQNGADIHQRGSKAELSRNPIIFAAFYKALNVVKFLEEKGANIHAVDSLNNGLAYYLDEKDYPSSSDKQYINELKNRIEQPRPVESLLTSFALLEEKKP